MALTANKRGITPIIAVILILMMTVAVAGTMYYWLTRMQGSQQGSVEQSQERLFEVLSACASIPTFSYNTITNVTNGAIQNCGNTKLGFGNTGIEDVAIVSSEGSTNPCSFKLNTTSCPACNFELNPGEVQLLSINFTAAGCSNMITEGIKHDITFYIDRKATVSRTFVPEPNVVCGISIGNYSKLSTTGLGASGVACYNMTISNSGNSEDTFTFANSTSGVNCLSAHVSNDGCGASTTRISQITIPANSNSTFSINQTLGGLPAGTCTAAITATSNNCASKTTSVSTSTAT